MISAKLPQILNRSFDQGFPKNHHTNILSTKAPLPTFERISRLTFKLRAVFAFDPKSGSKLVIQKLVA